jgi:hypothetical protein
MGVQFYHFDAFSRVESTSKAKSGKSIYSVAGEAERKPGYCDHVREPREPVLLFGVPYAEVVKLAEYYAQNTFDSQGRAVRKNGLCMIGGVISAPPDMTEKVWKVYKKACIEYLKEAWRDNLKSVIEHTDEYFEGDPEHRIKPGILHRHLHFACVPPAGVNFAEIHPGIKAKRKADKAYGVTKIPEGTDDDGFELFKKEGRQAGDRAYRHIMKQVQDDFFSHVGNPFGLLWYGPKRVRLSREEIINRDHEKRLKQKQAVELAEQEEKAKAQTAEIERVEKDLEKIRSEKQTLEDSLKSREKMAARREKAIAERETAVTAGERQQADFRKGLNTSLQGWNLPEPALGEFAGHYIKCIAGEVMGIVQRALNTIREYSRKKVELEKEKAAFEAEAQEQRNRNAARIAVSEKIHTEKMKGLKAAYEKLKSKVLGVKTPQELTALQRELSREEPHLSR